jgi:hypothetical protein
MISDIQEKFNNAEQEIRWIRDYRSDGDGFQQKRAMESLLELLGSIIQDMNNIKKEINELKSKDKSGEYRVTI